MSSEAHSIFSNPLSQLQEGKRRVRPLEGEIRPPRHLQSSFLLKGGRGGPPFGLRTLHQAGSPFPPPSRSRHPGWKPAWPRPKVTLPEPAAPSAGQAPPLRSFPVTGARGRKRAPGRSRLSPVPGGGRGPRAHAHAALGSGSRLRSPGSPPRLRDAPRGQSHAHGVAPGKARVRGGAGSPHRPSPPAGSPTAHAPGGSAITDAAGGRRRGGGNPRERGRGGNLAAAACALPVSGAPAGGPGA